MSDASLKEALEARGTSGISVVIPAYRWSATLPDLVLELPRNRPWVVETERGIVAKLEKGFHDALEDLQSSAAFVIYSGAQRYSKGPGIEAMGVREMAALS